MANKTQKTILGILILVVLTASIYVLVPEKVRIDVEKTKTTFKVWEDNSYTEVIIENIENITTENGTIIQNITYKEIYHKNEGWILAGTEYTKIYDGTTLMRANNRVVNHTINLENKTTIYRYAYFKDNISIIDTYEFDGNVNNVELVPVSHEIRVLNGQGKIIVYEVNDLLYTGETIKDISSPQSFGHNMEVEWESGNYYSRIWKYSGKDVGKLEIKYRIDSSDYSKNVRLFDPIIGINYKNNNMTIEFKSGETVLGQTTLKSHKTYDEVLKVTSGENVTVIWYEFSNFKDVQNMALGKVEFIDMRKEIVNESLLKDGGFIDQYELIILNPNYNKSYKKNYTLVYLDEKGNWSLYNSSNIPKGNITIGVQTDLFWGEFLDVRFNVFDNTLDRHALVLGTNYGFVTTAPTADPAGGGGIAQIDNMASVLRDTSPATAGKITEIGWFTDDNTEEANFEVGLYAADGAVVPGEAGTRLYVSSPAAKGTSAGWHKITGLDWSIESETVYWFGVAVTNTATGTYLDRVTSGGPGYDTDINSNTLKNPFGGGVIFDTDGGLSIYAVWEAGTPPPTYNSVSHNSTIANQISKFSILVNDETALHPNGAYIFSTNNTGNWVNDSAVLFSATPSWANVTKTLNSTAGTRVGYRWFINDTANNLNSTPIYELTTTTADTCTYTSGNWNILCSDYCNITSNVVASAGVNNITITGAGIFTTTANITGFKNFFATGGAGQCTIRCLNGGCFK